jgi:hypothetical protein
MPDDSHTASVPRLTVRVGRYLPLLLLLGLAVHLILPQMTTLSYSLKVIKGMVLWAVALAGVGIVVSEVVIAGLTRLKRSLCQLVFVSFYSAVPCLLLRKCINA